MDLATESERSGLQYAPRLELRSASHLELRWRLDVRWAEPQHAAELLLEEQLSQFSAVEPAALAP